MASWLKRFTREAILREKLELYGAMYRLDDGKYYMCNVQAYSLKDAERMVKKRLSDSKWFEYEPSDHYKWLIELHDYLYVYYIGK